MITLQWLLADGMSIELRKLADEPFDLPGLAAGQHIFQVNASWTSLGSAA